jgi:hypothetical protein
MKHDEDMTQNSARATNLFAWMLAVGLVLVSGCASMDPANRSAKPWNQPWSPEGQSYWSGGAGFWVDRSMQTSTGYGSKDDKVLH